jgi:ankyrin repeat protein
VVGKQPKRKDRPGVDRYGRTELHYAAARGEVERVRALLAEGADPNLADDNGWVPLHFAAQSRSLAICAALLEAGAEPDRADSHGNTPLGRAVFNSLGEGEIIQLLRRHGADPLRENSHGVSPLALAQRIGNYDVAQWFRDLIA